MKAIKKLQSQRERKRGRTRAKVFGTLSRPRLSVFRSNTHIYAQLIDDETGKTIVAFSDLTLKAAAKKSLVERARMVGIELAVRAMSKGVKKAVFDKGRFTYTGALAILADEVRKGGIIF